MTTSTRVRFTTAMLCAGIAVCSSAIAQSRPPVLSATPGSSPGLPGPPVRDPSARPAMPKGTATVTGRVVALDTGLPIRRARVLVVGVRSGSVHNGLSAADGTFTFRDLPADRYEMRASKARYVSGALGARRPGGQGRPFELADGQRLSGVTLALGPGGVVVGRVVDELGEPSAKTTVIALRQRRMPDGEARFVSSGEADTTDDTGSYRLYGLAPGRYVVTARPADADRIPGAADATSYPPTFFPGTAAPSEAQLVDVTAGSEAQADITLTPARVVTIRGVVIDAAGRPARGGAAMLMSTGPMSGLVGDGTAEIGGEGSFVLRGVPPGEYALNVQASFSRDASKQGVEMFKGAGFSVPLGVGGADIPDLRIVVPQPVTVTGRVVFEGGERGTGVHVSLNGARGLADSASARIEADGRLTVQVTPGARSLTAWGGRGWMLKQLTWNGRAIESGDEIEVEAEGGRVEAVFTNHMTAVTGTVVDGSGRAAQDYQVVIFPEDGQLLRRTKSRVVFERADQEGRFRTEGIPPGRYLAVATTDLDPDEALDPEVLESFRRAATAFRLDLGETETLALTLAPLRDQQP